MVTPESFVRAWTESETIAEVMQKTGMSRSAVVHRANSYRQRGVKLKRMKKGIAPLPLDPAALNRAIAAAQPQQQQQNRTKLKKPINVDEWRAALEEMVNQKQF